MTLSDANKVVKEASSWFGGPKHRKFGVTRDPRREQACEEIRAYLTCRGYLSTEQKKVHLGPDTTLEEARVSFGRKNMRQQRILDEDGYEIEDTSEFPWRHSNNCNVSLVFAYSREKEIERAITLAWRSKNNADSTTTSPESANRKGVLNKQMVTKSSTTKASN